MTKAMQATVNKSNFIIRAGKPDRQWFENVTDQDDPQGIRLEPAPTRAMQDQAIDRTRCLSQNFLQVPVNWE
ncbi:MAG: hypothetical protein ACKVHE_32270 [Planctomycetales bacterium]